MKVLLVNDYASPSGGAEVMTRVILEGLRRKGHDARVFATGVRAREAPSFADYECLGTTSRFRTLLQAFNPWAFVRLRRVLAEFRPDIVHVRLFLTQLSPSILPLLRDVASIHHVNWYRPVCPLGTKVLPDGAACRDPAGLACFRHRCQPLRDLGPLMLQMKLWRRWSGVFDLTVANSEACRRQLAHEQSGRIDVIWNGVPIVAPRPPLRDPPLVAFAGRLVPQKGADVLLHAFARVVTEMPGARLRLAGSGPEQGRLRCLVDELGVSSAVSMLGHLERPELEREFAATWVQAVPSRWAESFGLVAAEAMMRGTAVVASKTGGLPEFIQEGRTGLLLRPGDPDALAVALLALLRDRALAEEMGRRGRDVALSSLTDEVCVDRFVDAYREIERPRAGRFAP